MQKLIFTIISFLAVSISTIAQNWDKHMQVKKMSMEVSTDAFTATTFIEMEFFNPTNTEMEGLYRFRLDTGQAITAFQLDLFGKYRDGSIEEKWKATNAYNTIVGKRVDPALLTMNEYNNYDLRIYPVPAMSTRKITMTIQQLLIFENEKAIYRLPLNIKDVIAELNVRINVKGSTGLPTLIKGLLQDQVFDIHGKEYAIAQEFKQVKAEKPLAFSIPLSVQQPELCIKSVNEKTFFALRFKPSIMREYDLQPRKITVFWDVSAFSIHRDISKETRFLKDYIAGNNITQVTIISFNQQVQDTAVFYTANNFNSRWIEYLNALKYEGATHFGVLDFSKQESDAILLFSDGKNSFGSRMPTTGQTPVYCINSASYPDQAHLERIVGVTGGRFINLAKVSVEKGMEMASRVENRLMTVMVGNTPLVIDQQMHDLKGDVLFLTGTLPADAKQIKLSYGNNGKSHQEENIIITEDNRCAESGIDRFSMLSMFDEYANGQQWMNTLEFGRSEKVVTPNTAFIVLEKVEDYIKFKITPPKELESECDMNIFVTAEKQRAEQHKQFSEQEILSLVTRAYNVRIATWEKDQLPIDLLNKREESEFTEKEQKPKNPSTPIVSSGNNASVAEDAKRGNVLSMTEVVVTAMGQQRQPKELGYSVARINANELTQAKPVNLQNGLTGKVSGINVTTVNSGVFGDTRITLRGIRSLTGNNQPMLILDGMPISLQYINAINPNDIVDVTVLKSASATAIYGPDGANGALIITTRKGKRGSSYYWSAYKLKNQEDEDYLTEIKDATTSEKMERYAELKKLHGYRAGFYFDMAQHLFETGFRKQAYTILFSAAEVTGGDKQVLKAIAYTLENWKAFHEAIKVYEQIIAEGNADIKDYRNLAIALYQGGLLQHSVDVFYEGILKTSGIYESHLTEVKAMMLQEMNAIIAAHRSDLNISAINKDLIRPIDIDFRIVVDCNTPNINNSLSVREPDGTLCSGQNPTVNGGRLTSLNNYYNYYYYSDNLQEYQLKNAKAGKYRINMSYWGRVQEKGGIPSMIRIATFRNFGKPSQSIEIKNVIMDNQYGDVEIGEVKW